MLAGGQGVGWMCTDRKLMCVLEGSSVDFPCTYSYPSGLTVTEVFWHYMWFEIKPNDLREDEQFAGRVEFIGDKEKNCTLRIRDVRMNDSGEYFFRIITGSKGKIFSGNPGVTLKVTGIRKCFFFLIVQMLQLVLAPWWATLFCLITEAETVTDTRHKMETKAPLRGDSFQLGGTSVKNILHVFLLIKLLKSGLQLEKQEDQ
uniref:Immunoglobulin domain-containing protein n=1 Tax=Astyanax mexicanus TaxID=7994 RepID=A0A3B1KK17_ASTMX